MPKPPIRPELAAQQTDLIEVMRHGLHQWRPDLDGPESWSDWEAVARAVMQAFELKRRPISMHYSELLNDGDGAALLEGQADYLRRKTWDEHQRAVNNPPRNPYPEPDF